MKNVLISLGAGSAITTRITGQVIQALNRIGNRELSVRVILGALAGSDAELSADLSQAPYRVEAKQTTSNMANEMLWADVAITAGGSTMWELLYCRVPFLAVGITSPQIPFLERMEKEGICGNLGIHQELTDVRLESRIRDFLQDFEFRTQVLKKTEDWIQPKRVARELKAILSQPK